jgi:hypothetical protein
VFDVPVKEETPLARTPPHDNDAERSCLGAAMLSADAALLVPDPGDFYRPAHRTIASAIRDMAARGEPVDLVTLRAKLATGNTEQDLYLVEITRSVPTAANMGRYAEIVRDLAVKRRLVDAGANITRVGYEKDAPEAVAEAERLLATVPRNKRSGGSEPAGVLISDVRAEYVEWLWYARIPLGKVTLLDGDPGVGKSTLALELAARVTTGQAMPGDGEADRPPAGVVILSAEDGLADTIRPRLDAAGADVARVVALDKVKTADEPEGRLPTLPEDVPELRRAIERVSADLVIVDPLMAFLGTETNSYRDQDVRHALHPLVKAAEETGAAILVIRHLNKSTGANPLYRGGGSIAFIGGARSGLLAAKDPDDDASRVLASTKCNLAPQPESLAFHLEQVGGASRVVWDGVSVHDAGHLLAEPGDGAERSALAEAKEIVADVLADGPMPAKELRRRVMDEDVSERTLRRAREALGCVKRKAGMRGGWTWEMPPNLANNPRTCPPSEDGHLRESWPPSDAASGETVDVSTSPQRPERPSQTDAGEALAIAEDALCQQFTVEEVAL